MNKREVLRKYFKRFDPDPQSFDDVQLPLPGIVVHYNDEPVSYIQSFGGKPTYMYTHQSFDNENVTNWDNVNPKLWKVYRLDLIEE